MMNLSTRRVMNQNEIITSLIANSIITTASIANEISIQTKGEYIIPESDYLHIVKEFQVRLSKRIMPLVTQDDLRGEVKSYVEGLLSKHLASEIKEKDVIDESNGVPDSAEAYSVNK
jgi:hypothetical protein